YSDFLVYEIDQDENIVHITNTDIPNANVQSLDTSNNDIPVISTDQIFLDMKSLLGDETTEKPEKDKDKRTIIHKFFKNHFGNKLNTETKEGAIRISMHTSKTRNDRRNKRHELDQWATLGGSFCRFVLFKENRDTMEAINSLCKKM
ncbi:10592_t:CDS:2, partial [Scutellospora calospora]